MRTATLEQIENPQHLAMSRRCTTCCCTTSRRQIKAVEIVLNADYMTAA